MQHYSLLGTRYAVPAQPFGSPTDGKAISVQLPPAVQTVRVACDVGEPVTDACVVELLGKSIVTHREPSAVQTWRGVIAGSATRRDGSSASAARGEAMPASVRAPARSSATATAR